MITLEKVKSLLYRAALVISLLFLVGFAAVLPIDSIAQASESDNNALNTFIVVGALVLFTLFGITILVGRYINHRSCLRDIPRRYLPLTPEDLPHKGSRELLLQNMERSKELGALFKKPKKYIIHPGLEPPNQPGMSEADRLFPELLNYDSCVKTVSNRLKYQGLFLTMTGLDIGLNDTFSDILSRQFVKNNTNRLQVEKAKKLIDIYEAVRYSGKEITRDQFERFVELLVYFADLLIASGKAGQMPALNNLHSESRPTLETVDMVPMADQFTHFSKLSADNADVANEDEIFFPQSGYNIRENNTGSVARRTPSNRENIREDDEAYVFRLNRTGSVVQRTQSNIDDALSTNLGDYTDEDNIKAPNHSQELNNSYKNSPYKHISSKHASTGSTVDVVPFKLASLSDSSHQNSLAADNRSETNTEGLKGGIRIPQFKFPSYGGSSSGEDIIESGENSSSIKTPSVKGTNPRHENSVKQSRTPINGEKTLREDSRGSEVKEKSPNYNGSRVNTEVKMPSHHNSMVVNGSKNEDTYLLNVPSYDISQNRSGRQLSSISTTAYSNDSNGEISEDSASTGSSRRSSSGNDVDKSPVPQDVKAALSRLSSLGETPSVIPRRTYSSSIPSRGRLHEVDDNYNIAEYSARPPLAKTTSLNITPDSLPRRNRAGSILFRTPSYTSDNYNETELDNGATTPLFRVASVGSVNRVPGAISFRTPSYTEKTLDSALLDFDNNFKSSKVLDGSKKSKTATIMGGSLGNSPTEPSTVPSKTAAVMANILSRTDSTGTIMSKQTSIDDGF